MVMDTNTRTSFEHLVIGLFMQMAVAFCAPPVAQITKDCLLVAALCVICLFYGREHSQEERKIADRLSVNHANLWRLYPKYAAMCLWPGNWGKGNLNDFLFPVAAVTIVTVIAHIL